MENLKKLKINHILESLAMVAIGVVLVVWTKISLIIMARALAVLLVVVGLVFVLGYIFSKDKTIGYSSSFAVGLMIIAVGGWIFFKPDNFTDFIPKLFGVFILFSGLMNMGQVITLAKYKYSLWWISFVFAIGTLAMGAFLLFNPKEAKEIAVAMIGIFMIYNGVTNLWTVSRIGRQAKMAFQEANAVDAEAVVVEDGKKDNNKHDI